MSRTADIIACKLFEAGCRHAFGLPGGEVRSLMDGLKDAGIAFQLVKHENNGGKNSRNVAGSNVLAELRRFPMLFSLVRYFRT